MRTGPSDLLSGSIAAHVEVAWSEVPCGAARATGVGSSFNAGDPSGDRIGRASVERCVPDR
jgi:hypothetical protein